MIEEEKINCDNCGAEYSIKHDLSETDYKIRFCPFCGYEKEEDEFNDVEDRYEDWD